MRDLLDVDGGTFAWREAGTGELVVLLHGLGGSRTSWDPQLVGLGESHRVAAWDMPGYGAAAALPDEPLTFRALATAAATFIATLGATHAHIVGMSMGGMIAQYLAAWHPMLVRSVTLLATSPAFGLDGTDPGEWRATRLAPLDDGQEPSEFAGRVLRTLAGPNISADALDEQRAAMSRITGDALRRSIECLVTHDARPVLGAVAAPTLVAVGALDHETPVAYSELLVELIPNATLAVVADAGHLLNAEAPDAVNDLIAHHLAAAEAA